MYKNIGIITDINKAIRLEWAGYVNKVALKYNYSNCF
jgi:hypothetical protein